MANDSIISVDVDALKKDNSILKKELDQTSQELYDCKRQLKVQEALQHEYQSEIDMLQSDEIRQKQKYQEMISHLEESISNLRINYSEQIQVLETTIINLEEKNEALEAELDMVRKTNTSTTFNGDTTRLIEEILSLKEDNQGFTANQDELLSNLEDLKHDNLELQQALNDCREESSNLKESLECKRNELLEANNLIQKLNDNILCLKTELDSYKSQPLDEKSKGNSLFAEVDDRRVFLQETINKMKADYIAMKQERSQNLNTIHQLKLENMRLLDKWKSDNSEREDDNNEVVKTLQFEAKTLKDLIEKYKKDLESKPVVISKNNFEEIQYYQVVLNDKNKEINNLRDQIASRALTEYLFSTSLKEANEEKRKWRLEAISKQHQLDVIKSESNSQTVSETDSVVLKKVDSKSQQPNRTTDDRSDNVTRRNTNERAEHRRTTDTNNLEKKPDSRTIYNQYLRRSERDTRRDTQFRVSDFVQKDVTKRKTGEMVNIDEENVNVVEDIARTESCHLPKGLCESSEGKIVNETVCTETKILEDKENISENLDPTASNANTQPKKVTFSNNTVSPKKTRGAGKRVIVAKPVYFFSNPDK